MYCTAGPCCLSILYIVLCICLFHTANVSHSHSPFPLPPLPMITTLFSIRYRDSSRAIGSHDYGGWEVPQSAVCKLEVQGTSGVAPICKTPVQE